MREGGEPRRLRSSGCRLAGRLQSLAGAMVVAAAIGSLAGCCSSYGRRPTYHHSELHPVPSRPVFLPDELADMTPPCPVPGSLDRPAMPAAPQVEIPSPRLPEEVAPPPPVKLNRLTETDRARPITTQPQIPPGERSWVFLPAMQPPPTVASATRVEAQPAARVSQRTSTTGLK